MTDSTIDMSKLSERELLILLNQRVNDMNVKLDKVDEGHSRLRERVSNIETRHRAIAAIWGSMGVLITILINAFKLFK
jgi:hypothetical protein